VIFGSGLVLWFSVSPLICIGDIVEAVVVVGCLLEYIGLA